MRIGLVGDFDAGVVAHRAIPIALRRAADALQVPLTVDWLATDALPLDLQPFDGVWCVPASPYRDMAGALRAIRHAREKRVPFLGTCGGFQHAVIEIARNVMGIADAEHAETSPTALHAVIGALTCALRGVDREVRLQAGSRLQAANGCDTVTEAYQCGYGIEPAYVERLMHGPLRAVGHDAQGQVRAVELNGHPFFVGTLFQPERAALDGRAVPLAVAFIKGAMARNSAEIAGNCDL